MTDTVDAAANWRFWQIHVDGTLAKLRGGAESVVLHTDDGTAVTVRDEAELRQLMATAQREEMTDFLRRAKADIDAGDTVPAREFLKSLGRGRP